MPARAKVEEKKGVPTPGRVHHIAGKVRFYYKPSMDKVIIRKSGVIRTSEAVLEVNKAFATVKPASKCAGKPWHEFVLCLKETLKSELSKARR